MPLYTAIRLEGFLSDKTKTKLAQEIIRIHCNIMKVPKQFVRVVFLSYPHGSGFTAGEEAPTAASIVSYGLATRLKRKRNCSNNSGRCSRI
jgi:phenylpyruvate tautomerase PptA (4-oxalocrotonate tautomerase family)